MKRRFYALAALCAFISSSSLAADPPPGRDPASLPPGPSPSALGDVSRDFTYTSINPCRVVDTRVAGGTIAANSSRAFLAAAINSSANFTAQGGSATDCGLGAIGASAVSMVVTAYTPTLAGTATVYRSGDTRPATVSLSYAAGSVVSNTITVGIPNPLAITDFILYTSQQSHFTVDVIGYFSPPQATNLQCVDTPVITNSVAAGVSTSFTANACPAGYMATTPYCFTNATGVYLRGSGINANAPGFPAFCAWQNTTGSSQSVVGAAICCRVPGR